MELRDRNGLTEAEFLAGYRPGDYPRPSMAADVIIINTAAPFPQVLLIRRGGHPCLGQWAFPGGFVNPDETVGHAAARELQEETGITGVIPTQLFVYSQPGRDPRTWVMSCAHLAVLDTGQIPTEAGDDASETRWFTVTLNRKGEGCQKDLLYELRLEDGDTVLSSSLFCPPVFDEDSCTARNSEGLAFDHGAMILCGLKALFHI